jgi:hypothetical protein
MKAPIAIALVALVSLTATDASAYKLSPPDASVHLHGQMTFTPNEGNNPKPFTCLVTLDLKTKTGEIKAVKFPKGVANCEGVNFQGMPWYINILNANSGYFSFQSFISDDGNCVGDGNRFEVTKSGVWTFLTGQCLSGTLTSSPPTTIVKK